MLACNIEERKSTDAFAIVGTDAPPLDIRITRSWRVGLVEAFQGAYVAFFLVHG